MLIAVLAQAIKLAPKDKALLNLYFMLAIGGVGLLIVIGLIVAWRHNLQRQRELELDSEEREADMPHPDAWATAAQRISPDNVGPDEAHIASSTGQNAPDAGPPYEQEPDEEDDDFPFDADDDDDDDGPMG